MEIDKPCFYFINVDYIKFDIENQETMKSVSRIYENLNVSLSRYVNGNFPLWF